ncbi:signal peptidase I [Arthrobacter sp. MYb227]|uniref:signal peptidase I n=1 Tax=Arthrobacter sp. MYb227 TaxID=1848601 RepID=UPI000CFC52A3|nr:signal peptidase I [Arthrobacter sp. MYb227]PQZ87736.1 signal peptidase I [Arthrobacter sp. MYb227]
MTAPSPTKHRVPLWFSVLANLLAAIIVISLFQTFVAKIYQVPSGSMENTLNIGDRIIVNRWNSSDYIPQNNDVVVFNSEDSWHAAGATKEDPLIKQAIKTFGDVTGIGPSHERPLVKRVSASPGDTLECCSPTTGTLTRNGELLEEPYIFQDLPFLPGQLDCESDRKSRRCFGPIVVPEGKFLVMGDHRSNSSDGVSQCRGLDRSLAHGCARFVDEAEIVGRVSLVLWPFKNAKTL